VTAVERQNCRFLLLSEKMTKCQGNLQNDTWRVRLCPYAHCYTGLQRVFTVNFSTGPLGGGGSYRGIIPNRNGIKFKLKFIPSTYSLIVFEGRVDFLSFNLYRYRIIVSMLIRKNWTSVVCSRLVENFKKTKFQEKHGSRFIRIYIICFCYTPWCLAGK
jgi:hypothetical protein